MSVSCNYDCSLEQVVKRLAELNLNPRFEFELSELRLKWDNKQSGVPFGVSIHATLTRTDQGHSTVMDGVLELEHHLKQVGLECLYRD
jgi:hypothetical protein